MKSLLAGSIAEWGQLLPKLGALDEQLQQVGDALMACWAKRGKVLIAGNGGSAADAMHFAEELVVRFAKNRKALAAIALMDPTVLTCCGNDFGYERAFSRQIEALGNPGDVLVVLSTSGNSENLIRAIELAREKGMVTIGLLGKGGGRSQGLCQIELIVPSTITHRIQEAHKLLFHTICQWVDAQVE